MWDSPRSPGRTTQGSFFLTRTRLVGCWNDKRRTGKATSSASDRDYRLPIARSGASLSRHRYPRLTFRGLADVVDGLADSLDLVGLD